MGDAFFAILLIFQSVIKNVFCYEVVYYQHMWSPITQSVVKMV